MQKQKKSIALVLALIMLVNIIFVGMATVNAATPGDYFKKGVQVKFYPLKNSRACIETYGGSTGSGATIDIWNEWNTDSKFYTLIQDETKEYFMIRIKGSSNVMTPKESGVTAGTELTLAAPDAFNDTQWWSLVDLGNDAYMFINKASGMAMSLKGNATANGTKVSIEDSDQANEYSHWKLGLVKPDPIVPTSSIDKGLLQVGGTAQVTVENDQNVVYSSSNEEVATIDANGKITALKSGAATIVSEVEIYDEFAEPPEQFFTLYNPIMVEGEEVENALWNVASPNGKVKAAFAFDPVLGSLCYAAFNQDTAVIEPSPLGLKTSLGDFTKGLTFVSRTNELIEDSYDLFGARVSHVETSANETVLTFIKDGITYGVIVRAYNDGVAFRYFINSENENTTFNISSEHTGVQVPADAPSVIPYAYSVDNEGFPQRYSSVAQLKGSYSMPMTYKVNSEDLYVLVSEADIQETYCGAQLYGHSSGLVDIKFVPEQKTDVITDAPFQSPWRYAVIGKLSDITLNTMPENLSPPCAIEDTSWIKPGAVAWTWLNGDPCNDGETYKRYVDFCAEAGWEYLLLDEGWHKGGRGTFAGYYDWTEELVEYANAKGVGLIVWAHKLDLDTAVEQERIAEWAQMGFKGFKPDFFSSATQESIALVNTLIRTAAENKLLINPHGIYKPGGERRTYPNALTREGISGGEGRANYSDYNCTLPFTRFAVGPADFTPMASFGNVYQEQYNNATIAHLTAQSVVFESGLQCLADKPSIYRNHPAYEFYKNLPASWDESVLVGGEIGNYANFARRSGNLWYMGIMCSQQQIAEFSLDFLDSGKLYTAYLYMDGADKRSMTTDVMTVTKDSELSIPMLKNGGATVKIVPLVESATAPENVQIAESFDISVVTDATVTRVGLTNESGNKIGIQKVEKEVVGNQIVWTLTTSVGTAGEARKLSVQIASGGDKKMVDSGQSIVFDVKHQPAAVNSVEFNKISVVENELFGATVNSSSGITVVKVFNETGKGIGRTLVSRTKNADGTITWVFTQGVGTAGEARELTYKGAQADGVYSEVTASAQIKVVKAQ